MCNTEVGVPQHAWLKVSSGRKEVAGVYQSQTRLSVQHICPDSRGRLGLALYSHTYRHIYIYTYIHTYMVRG